MRVIAGEFRSRRLQSMPGRDVRPTPDRLRETLFDILGPSIAGTVFVDAYAGTGAVGIEALSRGAKEAVFIEKTRAGVELIRKNLENLGILPNAARARVVHALAAPTLEGMAADIIFLDPPYDLEREYTETMEKLEGSPARIVVQHSVRLPLREEYGSLKRKRTVRQGDNALSFY